MSAILKAPEREMYGIRVYDGGENFYYLAIDRGLGPQQLKPLKETLEEAAASIKNLRVIKRNTGMISVYNGDISMPSQIVRILSSSSQPFGKSGSTTWYFRKSKGDMAKSDFLLHHALLYNQPLRGKMIDFMISGGYLGPWLDHPMLMSKYEEYVGKLTPLRDRVAILGSPAARTTV